MIAHSPAGDIPAEDRRRGYVLTAGMLLVIMLGGTLPIPLYVLYETRFGFGPLGVTVVFVAYVLGTLSVLVALGDLSDHVGRRKVLALAVLCAMISSALFLAASSIGLLIVARIVSGMAAGFATGLFAEYVAMPTRSVFWAYVGVCALALAALAAIPETVRHPDSVLSLRPRLAVPPDMRTIMLGACLGVFAAFSVLGLFSSLVPTFLHGVLGVHNLALIGGGSFLIFVIAAISQAVSARLPARDSMSAGVPLLLVCLGTLEAALYAKALWLFLVGTVAGGVAVGFIFRGGLSEVNRTAAPRNRAAVVSTFFAVAYLGLGLPAVLIGLISLAIGPIDASVYISAVVAVIVVLAFFVVRRAFGAVPAPKPPCTPSDSWCNPEEAATAGSAGRSAR